jgi:cell division GTPase FtsZ
VAALQGPAPAFGLPGRIDAANSQPRAIALVGLGDGGAAIARAVADEDIAHLDVHVLARSAAGLDTLRAAPAGGGERQHDLDAADMIFLVACAGDDVALAAAVSAGAHRRGHSVTALYIVPPEYAARRGPDATLESLRASVEMLVVVSDPGYVPAMIAALGT